MPAVRQKVRDRVACQVGLGIPGYVECLRYYFVGGWKREFRETPGLGTRREKNNEIGSGSGFTGRESVGVVSWLSRVLFHLGAVKIQLDLLVVGGQYVHESILERNSSIL